jgi:hypothetical protein
MSARWMTERAAGWRAGLCAVWLLAVGCGDDGGGGAGDGAASDAAAANQGDGTAAADAGAAPDGAADEDAGTVADEDAGQAPDAGEVGDSGAAAQGPCAVSFSRDDSNRVASGTDIVTGCSAAAFSSPAGPSQVNFGAQDMAGDVMRMFNIDWFDAARDEGTELDVSQPYDYQTSKGAYASYVELGPSDKSPGWVATSGSVRLAKVAGGEYVVELKALKFEPNADGASGSTGSFEVSGTITANLE